MARALAWTARGRVSDAWVFAVAYTLLLPFFLAPLFVTRILPGLDLPFHLAAADMLGKAGRADSPYAAFYDGGLRIAPYAAHFLALVGLGKLMTLLAAHKLIIVFYVAGLPLAMASLLSACRRSRIPALLAFPLAYNLTLHYGFISFALSLPVVVLLLAEMAKLVHTDGRRAFALRWLVATAMAILLFLCHLQNFLYGVCAALAFAVLCSAPILRKLAAVTSLIPAFVGLAYWHLTSPPVTGQAKLTPALAWRFLKEHRLQDMGRESFLTDMSNRIISIPIHALRGFTDDIHNRACRGLVLVMLAYLAIGFVAWCGPGVPRGPRPTPRGRLRVAGVIVFLGALFAYLALPHHLQELELMTFFPRFSVLVLLMFLLLVPAGLLRLRGLLFVLLPVPALVFGALYGRQLYLHYRAYAAEVAGFVDVVEKTPPGGRALGLMFDRKSKVMQVESALLGIVGFYPAMRPAPGSMAPPMYCGLRHMPCRLKVAPDYIPSPWAPDTFNPAKVLPNFDYFFTRSMPPGFDPFRGYHGMVERIAESGVWVAFRKKPGPLVPDPPPAPPPPPRPPAPAVVPAPPPAPPPHLRKRPPSKPTGTATVPPLGRRCV